MLYHLLDALGIDRPTPPKKKHHLALCRERKNDVWLTPECVAQDHIKWTAMLTSNCHTPSDYAKKTWLDPYRNTGNYYNNFPPYRAKDWAEILEGKDALSLDYDNAIVCSNPPYSCLAKHLDYMATNNASVISVLVMTNHITTPRLNRMKEAGYTLAGMKFYNVRGYMNTAVAIAWFKEQPLHYDQPKFEYVRGGFRTEGEPIREPQEQLSHKN